MSCCKDLNSILPKLTTRKDIIDASIGYNIRGQCVWCENLVSRMRQHLDKKCVSFWKYMLRRNVLMRIRDREEKEAKLKAELQNTTQENLDLKQQLRILTTTVSNLRQEFESTKEQILSELNELKRPPPYVQDHVETVAS